MTKREELWADVEAAWAAAHDVSADYSDYADYADWAAYAASAWTAAKGAEDAYKAELKKSKEGGN
jgi:hypothetical protein